MTGPQNLQRKSNGLTLKGNDQLRAANLSEMAENLKNSGRALSSANSCTFAYFSFPLENSPPSKHKDHLKMTLQALKLGILIESTILIYRSCHCTGVALATELDSYFIGAPGYTFPNLRSLPLPTTAAKYINPKGPDESAMG